MEDDFPRVDIQMMIRGEPGPIFHPHWPDPVDPRLDIGPLDTQPAEAEGAEANVTVVDSLGETRDPTELRSLRSWMGVSTNSGRYNDGLVLETAKWAAGHTAGFTLVVSDELNRYNWIAERGDWAAYDEGKHVRSLKNAARKRALEFRQLFDEHGIFAGVVLWSRMHRKIVEESCENDIKGMVIHAQEWRDLNDAMTRPEFSERLDAIHKTLAAKIMERTIEKGYDEDFVNLALSGYSIEEIFMTVLLARTGWANIKIGPEWEKYYDTLTADYLARVPGKDGGKTLFGAVYLEATS